MGVKNQSKNIYACSFCHDQIKYKDACIIQKKNKQIIYCKDCYKDKYVGIGGWLTLFVISVIWQTVSFLFTGDILEIVLISLLGFILLGFLFTKSKYSIALSIIWLWTQVLLQIKNSFLLMEPVVLAISAIIYATIWTLYFSKSKRVRNTFTKYI